MKDLSVSKFKATLAEQLRRVKSGETIVLTEHKRPVAQVAPLSTENLVERPANRPFAPVDPIDPGEFEADALSVLAEERGER